MNYNGRLYGIQEDFRTKAELDPVAAEKKYNDYEKEYAKIVEEDAK